MRNYNIKIVFIFYAICSLPVITLGQSLFLGDYIPGNGITLASDDDNYKVTLMGYAQIYLNLDVYVMIPLVLINLFTIDFELEELD